MRKASRRRSGDPQDTQAAQDARVYEDPRFSKFAPPVPPRGWVAPSEAWRADEVGGDAGGKPAEDADESEAVGREAAGSASASEAADKAALKAEHARLRKAKREAKREARRASKHLNDHSRRRRTVKNAFLLLLLMLTLAIAIFSSALVVRAFQERLGLGVVESPTITLENSDANATGRFTVDLEYTTMAASDGSIASAEIVWDDSWFFEDPTEYNQELAIACAVLSTIANSESDYYQSGSGETAYLEEALAKLGFTEVSTTSYQYRSKVIDEILDL